MKNRLYVEKRDVYCYPSGEYGYSPSKKYPEYKYKDISPSENAIYDMVRCCLRGMDLDVEHYDTPEWNPLGRSGIISKGDTVILKPNLVIHENYMKNFGLDCLVTHPSVIRAIADYVLIALEGTGEIIIGDAPVQSCNFQRLISEHGYDKIVEFYAKHKIKIPIIDFRLVKSESSKFGFKIIEDTRGKTSCIAVRLGKESAFHGLASKRLKNLRVTNYDPLEMNKHHYDDVHEYLIHEQVLAADVIINLPKPKTHRIAGVTCALKNIVGINGDKDWLPHHTKGSVVQGGDEYLNKSVIKYMKTIFSEKADISTIKNKKASSIMYKSIRTIFTILSKLFSKDNFVSGGWYGNDTIWRTIYDLNKILLLADKKGVIRKEQQRKEFIIADMIISGEKEGPMCASPKKVGAIAAGINPIDFDKMVATLMGFDTNKIPSIRNIDSRGLELPQESPIILYTNTDLNGKELNSIKREETYKFVPSSGWIGHIEME